MLEIFANNQPLDTAGVSFNLTLKSSLFEYKSRPGSYAYNIQLPNTERNKSLYKFPGRLEKNDTDSNDFNFRAEFNGVPFINNSKQTIDKIGQMIATNVKINAGNFNDSIKDVFLHDVITDSQKFNTADDAKYFFITNLDKNYPDCDFILPMIESQADSYLPAEATIYHHKDIFNWFDTSLSPDSYVIEDGSSHYGVLVPMLFLRYVIDNVFSSFGYQVDDRFFTQDDLSKLIIFNLYNCNVGILVPGLPLYGSSILDIQYSTLIPEILISDFLINLKTLFNIDFFIDDETKTVKIASIDEIITDDKYIEFSNNVENLKEVDFEQYDGYQLKINPDDGDEWFKAAADIEANLLKQYGGQLEKLSDLPEEARKIKYYYVYETGDFYKWDIGIQDWKIDNTFIKKLITTIFKENKQFEVESDISYLLNDPDTSDDFITFSQSYQDYLDIKLRLMFNLGRVSDYPRCHFETTNRSLQWYGTNGLYEKNWKYTIEWLQKKRKLVTFKKQLTAVQISQIDFTKKYRVEGIDYILNEIKIPITEKTIQAATITAWKV